MGGFGQINSCCVRVDGYRMNGIDTSLDCYPYFAFPTRIAATTYDDGWLERYHCDYSACQLTEGKYKARDVQQRPLQKCAVISQVPWLSCYVFMDEKDIRIAFADPGVMVGSDGLIDNGHGHQGRQLLSQRFHTEFVKKRGHFSVWWNWKDDGCSLQSAWDFLIKETPECRCRCRCSYFWPGKIKDGATFDDPMIPPTGIDYVHSSAVRSRQKTVRS